MFIIEFFFYATLLLLFYYFSSVHSQFRSAPLFYKLYLILFIYFLTIGQVNKSPQHTYPFTYWGMYSQFMPVQNYNEYILEINDGTSIRYPFELVTFTSQRAFMARLEILLQHRKENEEFFDQTLEGLISIYEEAYPDRHVETFTINRVHISLTDNEAGYQTSASPIFVKIVEQ